MTSSYQSKPSTASVVKRTLVVGAQSSLTGGATPFGDRVISTARLQGVRISADGVRVGAGTTLSALQEQLASGKMAMSEQLN